MSIRLSPNTYIAIGLALGMPASEILSLYRDNARKIFPHQWPLKNKCKFLGGKGIYERTTLKKLLSEAYDKYAGESPARLGHCKTRVCIPAYDASRGMIHVFKTPHHPELKRDYQIPACDIALSTAAAPVYFDTYNFEYKQKGGTEIHRYVNMIDGGIMANNPTLIGYTEATYALNVPIEELAILSIGTGNRMFKDETSGMAGIYWLYNNKEKKVLPLYDLISSAQADYTDNLMKYYQKGIGEGTADRFIYHRLQHSFENGRVIDMDASDKQTLIQLENIGQNIISDEMPVIMQTFFRDTKSEYIPYQTL